MKFLSLPEDCLRLILKRISLADLRRLCLVCQRFSALIEIVFKTKYSLKLFTGSNQLQNYRSATVRYFGPCDSNDVLYLSESLYVKTRIAIKTISTATKSSQVAALLPNIRELVSVAPLSPQSSAIDLVNLFSRWSTTLVSFTLFRQDGNRNKEHMNTFHCVCTAMDSLASLKQLHIYGTSNWTIPADQMLVFGRLEELTLDDYRFDVKPIISRLDANLMKHLRLRFTYFQTNQNNVLFECNSELASNLSHFTYGNQTYSISRAFSPSILTKLTALTYLDLSGVEMILLARITLIEDLFFELSRKANLKELKLKIDHIYEYVLNSSYGNPDLKLFLNTRMVRLPSIECLHLIGNDFCFDNLRYMQNYKYNFYEAFPLMFASLKSICVFYRTDFRVQSKIDDTSQRITQYFTRNFDDQLTLIVQKDLKYKQCTI